MAQPFAFLQWVKTSELNQEKKAGDYGDMHWVSNEDNVQEKTLQDSGYQPSGWGRFPGGMVQRVRNLWRHNQF